MTRILSTILPGILSWFARQLKNIAKHLAESPISFKWIKLPHPEPSAKWCIMTTHKKLFPPRKRLRKSVHFLIIFIVKAKISFTYFEFRVFWETNTHFNPPRKGVVPLCSRCGFFKEEREFVSPFPRVAQLKLAIIKDYSTRRRLTQLFTRRSGAKNRHKSWRLGSSWTAGSLHVCGFTGKFRFPMILRIHTLRMRMSQIQSSTTMQRFHPQNKDGYLVYKYCSLCVEYWLLASVHQIFWKLRYWFTSSQYGCTLNVWCVCGEMLRHSICGPTKCARSTWPSRPALGT